MGWVCVCLSVSVSAGAGGETRRNTTQMLAMGPQQQKGCLTLSFRVHGSTLRGELCE